MDLIIFDYKLYLANIFMLLSYFNKINFSQRKTSKYGKIEPKCEEHYKLSYPNTKKLYFLSIVIDTIIIKFNELYNLIFFRREIFIRE